MEMSESSTDPSSSNSDLDISQTFGNNQSANFPLEVPTPDMPMQCEHSSLVSYDVSCSEDEEESAEIAPLCIKEEVPDPDIIGENMETDPIESNDHESNIFPNSLETEHIQDKAIPNSSPEHTQDKATPNSSPEHTQDKAIPSNSPLPIETEQTQNKAISNSSNVPLEPEHIRKSDKTSHIKDFSAIPSNNINNEVTLLQSYRHTETITISSDTENECASGFSSGSESDSSDDSSSESSSDDDTISTISSDDPVTTIPNESPKEANEVKSNGEVTTDTQGNNQNGQPQQQNPRKKKKNPFEEDLELPLIEDLQISVKEEEAKAIGAILQIVSTKVVIQAEPDLPPIDLDSVLFVERGSRALGRVFDVFGHVQRPLYVVLFASVDQVKEKGVSVGEPVYFAPQTEHTNYVIMDELLNDRGSDASWKDNREPPVQFLEYSDDEEERKAKQARRKTKAVKKAESVIITHEFEAQTKKSRGSGGNQPRNPFIRPLDPGSFAPPRITFGRRNPVPLSRSGTPELTWRPQRQVNHNRSVQFGAPPQFTAPPSPRPPLSQPPPHFRQPPLFLPPNPPTSQSMAPPLHFSSDSNNRPLHITTPPPRHTYPSTNNIPRPMSTSPGLSHPPLSQPLNNNRPPSFTSADFHSFPHRSSENSSHGSRPPPILNQPPPSSPTLNHHPAHCLQTPPPPILTPPPILNPPNPNPLLIPNPLPILNAPRTHPPSISSFPRTHPPSIPSLPPTHAPSIPNHPLTHHIQKNPPPMHIQHAIPPPPKHYPASEYIQYSRPSTQTTQNSPSPHHFQTPPSPQHLQTIQPLPVQSTSHLPPSFANSNSPGPNPTTSFHIPSHPPPKPSTLPHYGHQPSHQTTLSRSSSSDHFPSSRHPSLPTPVFNRPPPHTSSLPDLSIPPPPILPSHRPPSFS